MSLQLADRPLRQTLTYTPVLERRRYFLIDADLEDAMRSHLNGNSANVTLIPVEYKIPSWCKVGQPVIVLKYLPLYREQRAFTRGRIEAMTHNGCYITIDMKRRIYALIEDLIPAQVVFENDKIVFKELEGSP